MTTADAIFIEDAPWSALREHLKRDAIVVVSEELDLAHVTRQVVADAKDQVALWIDSGLVAKPSREQLAHWEHQPETRFRFSIAQPFVLIQALAN